MHGESLDDCPTAPGTLLTRDSSTEIQCFNITSTLPDIRENSPWHPIYGYGIIGTATTPEADQNMRNSSTPSFEYDESISNFNVPRNFEHSVLFNVPDRSGHSVLFNVPGRSGHSVLFNVPERSEHSMCDRKQFLDTSEAAVEIRTLKFLLSLPLSKRPYTWDEIQEDESEPRGNVSPGSPSSSELAQSREGQDDIEVHIPCGHAILRTFNQDIELLPPDYPNALRTFCRGVVEQRLGDLRDQLRHFDRLNMLAVIPELSLVVAASQIGRAALITLTRLGDEFSSLTMPVVMFRLDLILPLKMHEDEYRPWVPLAGMAVAPLQASASETGKFWPGQRWRLLLHYVDQTILSYELYRNEEGELIVL